MTRLLGAFSPGSMGFSNETMMVRAIPWGVFTVWSQLTANDGWKVLTDEEMITSRILQRNGTLLSISDNTFVIEVCSSILGVATKNDLTSARLP